MAPQTKCRVHFQAPEHRSIGDRAILRFSDGDISGNRFNYVGPGFPDGLTLTLGQIFALAGDFYGNCQLIGDAEQISDQWQTNPEASIQRFLSNTDLLNDDTKGYLQAVVSVMLKQDAEIKAAIQNGQDVAQAFKLNGDKHDTEWAFATKGDYLLLALCNWDHFGQDAISAYSAGHTAALRQARLAQNTGDSAKLRYAYFLEGFACHFLTDLFSTGHMRTPRRLLHKTYFGWMGPTASDENSLASDGLDSLEIMFWPADQCARAMHDEDCANGLWVTNAESSASWPAYGDSQLFSPKGNLDFDAALDAVQTGINEFQIPALDDMTPPNFPPLFKSDGTNLYLRSNVDNRCLSTYDDYPLSSVPWTQILQRILDSGESQNQLPLTLELLCPTIVLHLRVIDDLNFSVAQYGTVYSQSSTTTNASVESWNMLKQTTLSVPQSSGQTTWNAAQKIDDGVYSLVGRVLLPSKDLNGYHVGLKVTSNDVKVLWADEVQDGDSAWTAGNVWYGRFDADKDVLAMIKHWYKVASPWKSKLELWTFESGTQNAPKRKKTDAAFSLRIQSQDVSDTFVTSALDTSVSPDKTLWTFSTWKNGYSSLVYSTCEESLSERAQKTIVKCGATSSTANRVIRLFYGEKYSKSAYIRIDVLQLSTSSVTTISTSEFTVTWSGQNYLTWFLSDVDADGNLDLIGLVAADDGSLTMLTFKPKSVEASGFETPVVSSITSDKGALLTASFMTPILARQANYKFPGTTYQVDSSVLMAFDNYGVIGVRLLRPKSYSGTLEYEIGGQLPAVAGQESATLGQVTQLFETAKEPVGLFIEY
ncbi:MAG: hypothetical protein Q9195_005451 [Heterodermia aff. obscurata]